MLYSTLAEVTAFMKEVLDIANLENQANPLEYVRRMAVEQELSEDCIKLIDIIIEGAKVE